VGDLLADPHTETQREFQLLSDTPPASGMLPFDDDTNPGAGAGTELVDVGDAILFGSQDAGDRSPTSEFNPDRRPWIWALLGAGVAILFGVIGFVGFKLLTRSPAPAPAPTHESSSVAVEALKPPPSSATSQEPVLDLSSPPAWDGQSKARFKGQLEQMQREYNCHDSVEDRCLDMNLLSDAFRRESITQDEAQERFRSLRESQYPKKKPPPVAGEPKRPLTAAEVARRAAEPVKKLAPPPDAAKKAPLAADALKKPVK
jgi:hypothetical protein